MISIAFMIFIYFSCKDGKEVKTDGLMFAALLFTDYQIIKIIFGG